MINEKTKVTQVDPRKIIVPEVRITTVWDDEELKAFSRDVKESGIETPLLVAKDGEKLLLIDGLHRLQEALLTNLSTVPCVIREMSTKEMYMRNLASNTLRGKAPVSQEIRVIKELRDKEHCSIEEIQKGTGFSRERVETLTLISQGHPGILDALDLGTIGIGHAQQLLRLNRPTQISFFLGYCAQERPTVKAFTQIISDTLQFMQESTNKPAATPINEPQQAPLEKCFCCHKPFTFDQLTRPILCFHCLGSMLNTVEMVKKTDKTTNGEKGE